MEQMWRWPSERVHHVSGSAGALTFVGGAGAFDSSGHIAHPGDLDAQIVAAVGNVADALAAEGAALSDIVRVKAYYTSDVDDWHVIARIAELLADDPMPAISTVPEPLQPFDGQVIQLQVIALKGWRSGSDVRFATRPVPPTWQDRFGARQVTGGLRAGEFIAVSNRTAADEDGAMAEAADGVAQSHSIMACHEATLAELGAGMQDCVKMEGHFYGTTRADWAPLALARASHFAEPGPPATVVPCQRLNPEGAVTKIDVLAMREKRNSYDKYIPRQDSWPDRVWDWPLNLPYRQAVRLRGTIWLGGQVPSEPYANSGRRMMPGNLAGQTRMTMSYIEDLLRGFNRRPADLKLMVCYYTCSEGEKTTHMMLDLLSQCLGSALPPTTLVPKTMMHTPENTVEIWGVAQG
ncbi:MAG: family 15 carbohydrate-binding domain-containing protein [Rhizobiales bacterium]|nr:family 15 carbohydrate-binding domain-containing protein [Hyphomicrobiales bacterium]